EDVEQDLEHQAGGERGDPEQRPQAAAEHVPAGCDADQAAHHPPHLRADGGGRGGRSLRAAHRANPAASRSRPNRLSGSAASVARGPYSTTRPPSTTAIWSTRDSDDSRWAMSTPVRRCSSRATAASTRSSVAGSSRLEASSSTTRPGSV